MERFILFRQYYQLIAGSDINPEIMNLINNIMDYHYEMIYGENYPYYDGIKDNEIFSIKEY